jgi:hypothetical protein
VANQQKFLAESPIPLPKSQLACVLGPSNIKGLPLILPCRQEADEVLQRDMHNDHLQGATLEAKNACPNYCTIAGTI